MTKENDAKNEERVLVIPTDAFRKFGTFQGFSDAAATRANALFDAERMTFMRRADAERNPEFKQIIPYVIFEFERADGKKDVFAYRRGAGQGEKRLVSKWSVGIGGHINDRDLVPNESGLELVLAGARREIEEEVVVEAPIKSLEIVGLVNDDATEVGTVHLGVVCRATLDAPAMWANESDITEARFRTVEELLAEIRTDHDQFESWTTLALENLYRTSRSVTMPSLPRVDGRALDETRTITFTRRFTKAAGSVLAKSGDTVVLCTASVVEDVPEWMKRDGATNKGWITAEYRMLPSSAQTRKPRQDRPDGRATEIQRLIGRAARSVCEPEALGPRTIYLDCDVLQADGGTRTLSISGAFVALVDAIVSIRDRLPDPTRFPLRDAVAAISVGIVNGEPMLDLCYREDSAADVDMNVVATRSGRFVELQGAGEGATFDAEQLSAMLALARKGVAEISALQRAALGDAWPFG